MEESFSKHQEPPEHGSVLRSVMSSALGVPYHSHHDLAEVKKDPLGVVILEADEGGQILVVARAGKVVCDEPVMTQLLMIWTNTPGPGATRIRPGSCTRASARACIPGGMGGGLATDGIWVHPRLVEDGLESAIVEVLDGKRERVFEDDP
jgi:hypothetical protein